MDPFVVTSLGRKTLRTPVIRHNLNPVYHEKMVFQVMKHEQTYTISFTVMDRDKFSGNDFVASASFPLQKLIQSAPEADLESGLYHFVELDPPSPTKSSPRFAVSPSPSSQSLSKMGRPPLKSRGSANSVSSQTVLETPNRLPPTSVPEESGSEMDSSSSTLPVPPASMTNSTTTDSSDSVPPADEEGLREYKIPLILKNRDRWEDKHSPELFVKAKYLPYSALRQQFWRLMLKQYDADDSGRIDKVEMTTMLDTLGSTLKESTIDGFFKRFSNENESEVADLTFDQCVICLEDTLRYLQKKNSVPGVPAIPVPRRPGLGPSPVGSQESEEPSSDEDLVIDTSTRPPSNANPQETAVPTISSDEQPSSNDEELQPGDLGDERGEEHVVEVRECPLCHQPRLAKRSDADIITHIATCASHDWRQVDNLVMGGFVTSSQAQRKWYSKVITKISYGGYRLGANSANILIQDRITGQINEERMSVYVRLGIRLLYKGLKSKEMEKKRSKIF
jgi:phosphatidylserine decarboxylase